MMYKPQDHIQQLADYIKKNLNKGYTLDSLRFSLINQGYSRISVEKAIGLANKQLAVIAPEIKEKPQITYRLIDEKNKPVKTIQILPKAPLLRNLWAKLRDFFA